MILCAAWALAPSLVEAANWPQFRGLDEGRVDAEDAGGVPALDSEEAVAWEVGLPGPGHSSPVVWEDRVILTCEGAGGERSRSVVCLSADDGRELWKTDYRYQEHSLHRFNNDASSTACTDGIYVYLTWTGGDEREALALDLKDGAEVWRVALGSFGEEHGSGASPVLAGETLLVSNDHAKGGGALFGLDRRSGEVRWKLEREASKASFSTPILTDDGAVALFAGTPYGVTAVDVQSGEVVWDAGAGFDERTVASPVRMGDTVFVTSGNGGGKRQALVVAAPKGKAKPEPAWPIDKGLPYVPTPVVANGFMFMWNDGGIVTCIRERDGQEMWRERVSGEAYASPIAVGDRIIGCDRQGKIWSVRAAGEFEVLSELDLGEPINATPAVSGGKMFVRTAGRLVCFGG